MANLKKRKLLSRVDVQVSLLVTLITLASTGLTGMLFYSITYEVMVGSLTERVYALYDMVEKNLDKETFFHINDPEDMNLSLYKGSKAMLLSFKESTGVMYLYTAKESEDGTFVYVIDGLEEYEDFRKPGDRIEPEISAQMHRALLGEYIIPDQPIPTDWGVIYISYLPVHNSDGDIIGVVGIEFEADDIYTAFTVLKTTGPFVILVFTSLAMLISFVVFRRISNPFYMDMATTDTATNLKNRNAFEVDINNFMVRSSYKKIGIIMVDVNRLKFVNDNLGHSLGDDYIKLVADCIIEARKENMIAYRVGGDEFVIIVQDATQEQLDTFIYECTGMVRNQTRLEGVRSSISCGAALFHSILDKNLMDTYERADSAMYQCKKIEKDLSDDDMKIYSADQNTDSNN